MPDRFSFFPATTDRLAEIEAVFDDCADARNCRCAYWYLPNADYKAGWGEGNRSWFRSLVAEPRPPGILAYHENEPAGWCGVAPRVVFDRLRRSKPFAPVDDTPVWSINCFIVRKPFRRQGLSRLLLKRCRRICQRKRGRLSRGIPCRPSGPRLERRRALSGNACDVP